MTATAEAPLLATKLFVPAPRQNRVSRPRLRDQLEAAGGGTVTLAAAPAGSGKSTLIADWAAATEKAVAWVSLDPGDDEPRRFLHYVIAALRNAGVITSDALAGGTSAKPGALESLLTETLNAISAYREPAVVVLDDYHVIENDSVHALVQRMIDRLPPNLHLVLASRVDPPLALSRLRARNTLLELRAADLRFTDLEAAQFFNEVMGLSLTPEQIGELEKRTEGWAVGLQMAAISLRGRAGAKNFISSFSGSNRYVLDYLTDEVLHRQRTEIRSFLLETSILGRLSAPLCDAVTGRHDAARILEQLDAANLFLIPLDDVRYWYRYHHLFGSLLQHELERSHTAAQIAELHKRASQWYASNRMAEAAITHAVAGGDVDRAAAIVSEEAGTRMLAGDGGTVARWIAKLPRERVEQDFDLLILHSRALTAEYQLEYAMSEVALAERVIPEEDRRRAEGTVLSVRGLLQGMLGQPAVAAETLARAMPLLERDSFWFSMTSFHIGIAALIDTDLRRAEHYLEEATASRDQPDGVLTAVLSKCYGGWSALWRGLPDRAVQMAHEANAWIESWDAQHHTGRPLSSLAYGLLADTYRWWNELDQARKYAELALEFGRTGMYLGYVEASRVMSQVAGSQGDWDTAIAAAREMACAARCAGSLDGMGPVTALEYRVLWRRGRLTGNRQDLETVARWCEQSGFLDVTAWRKHLHAGMHHDFALTIAASVLIHQKRYDEAGALVDAMFDEAVERERIPAQIGHLVLRSQIEAATGQTDSAVATMAGALALATGPRFILSFVDEKSALLPIVERAAPLIADRDFATRVLSAFDSPTAKPQPMAADDGQALSEREIEVLRLIAAGASNQEAARKLFVAPSTVKKHLENIYAKLAVGGRTQAVARARELQIL